VNWEHFKAFVWLRWRLLYNQQRKAGVVSAVLLMIIAIGAVLTAIPLFIGSFILGLYAIPKAEPVHLMYVWDGLVAAFTLFWMIGLITELQRSDPLSLSKFMHLPVSATGAFMINYLGSLIRLSLIIFGPVMLAFSLALIVVKGVSMVPVLLLLAAFLLMVTAVTYQFQGWLAALMSNPRRRRSVIMVITIAFVLIAQLPNLIQFLVPRGPDRRRDMGAAVAEEMQKLDRSFASGEISEAEHGRRAQETMEGQKAKFEQADRAGLKDVERTARFINMVVPLGWLPLGVVSAAEGNFLVVGLGLLGMTLIGAGSLFRAYRTTVALYQGQFTNRKGKLAPVIATPVREREPELEQKREPRALLLEARLPAISEPVAAVALAGIRSLVRAPEAKMMLLSPVIMGFIFGSMLWRNRAGISEPLRPLVAIGGMVFVLIGLVQLMANQFGFDRDGFRVFVLSSARRRDILMGKNLSFAPIALILAAILLVALQILCPLRWDHFLAMIPQFLSMFMLFCILTNLLSIYAPMHISAGSLKATSMKLTTALLHMASFMVIFPLSQSLTLIPWGAELAVKLLGYDTSIPICLILSLLECAGIAAIYHYSLDGLGHLYQGREQKILDVVTKKAA